MKTDKLIIILCVGIGIMAAGICAVVESLATAIPLTIGIAIIAGTFMRMLINIYNEVKKNNEGETEHD